MDSISRKTQIFVQTNGIHCEICSTTPKALNGQIQGKQAQVAEIAEQNFYCPRYVCDSYSCSKTVTEPSESLRAGPRSVQWLDEYETYCNWLGVSVRSNINIKAVHVH